MDNQVRPVATRSANAYGLFDMLGNVQELCIEGSQSSLPSGSSDTWTPALVLKGGRAKRDGYALPRGRVPRGHGTPESIGWRLSLCLSMANQRWRLSPSNSPSNVESRQDSNCQNEQAHVRC